MKNLNKISLALIVLVLALASTASVKAETFQKRFNHYSSALEECGGYHNARLYACKTSDMSNSCIRGSGMSWGDAETFFNNLPRHGSPYCGGVWVVYDEGVQEVVQNNDQPQDQGGYADNGFGSQIGQFALDAGSQALGGILSGGFQGGGYGGGGYAQAPVINDFSDNSVTTVDDHSVRGSYNTSRVDSHNRSRVDSHNHRTVNPAPTPFGTPVPAYCLPVTVQNRFTGANNRTPEPGPQAAPVGNPVEFGSVDDPNGGKVVGHVNPNSATGIGAKASTTSSHAAKAPTTSNAKASTTSVKAAKQAPAAKVAKGNDGAIPFRTTGNGGQTQTGKIRPSGKISSVGATSQARSARTSSARPMQQMHRSAPATRVRQAPRMQQRPTFRSAPRMQRSAPRTQSHGGGGRHK